jgi:hypothetical protein
MRRRIIRVFVVAVLMVCVCAHISELFDTWDHTLQTGNEIESTLVAVALCIGACVVLVSVFLRFLCSLLFGSGPAFAFRPLLASCTRVTVSVPFSASPPPLRV